MSPKPKTDHTNPAAPERWLSRAEGGAGAEDRLAALIRAAEPLNGWHADLSGPAKLARAMRITTRADNGLDLTGNKLFLMGDGTKPQRVVRSKRILPWSSTR